MLPYDEIQIYDMIHKEINNALEFGTDKILLSFIKKRILLFRDKLLQNGKSIMFSQLKENICFLPVESKIYFLTKKASVNKTIRKAMIQEMFLELLMFEEFNGIKTQEFSSLLDVVFAKYR